MADTSAFSVSNPVDLENLTRDGIDQDQVQKTIEFEEKEDGGMENGSSKVVAIEASKDDSERGDATALSVTDELEAGKALEENEHAGKSNGIDKIEDKNEETKTLPVDSTQVRYRVYKCRYGSIYPALLML